MANGNGIDVKKIDELIDKISKLTTAMENGHIGGQDHGGKMYPYWRRNNSHEYTKTYDELSEMEQAYYRDMRERRKQELEKEIQDLENHLSQLRSKRKEDQRKTLEELEKEEQLKAKKQEKKVTDSKESEKYYYDYKTKRVGSQAAWDYMPKQEREKWGSFNRFKQEGDFLQKSERREELSRKIYESGLGDTKAGRYAQSFLSRSERIQNLASFAGKASEKLASKAASKGAGLAAKGLGAFSKGLGAASKLLGAGGPWFVAVKAAIETFHEMGKKVSEFLTYLANAQALGLETSAKIMQLRFEQEKETKVANINLQTEGVKYQGDLQLKMMDMQGQIMLNNLKLQTEQYAKSVGIALGPLLEGINDAAYRAAESSIDFAASFQKNKNIQSNLEQQYANYQRARNVDYTNQQNITQKNLELLNKQTEAGILEVGLQIQQDYNDSPWMRQFYTKDELYNNKDVQASRNKYNNATGINTESSIDANRQYLDIVGKKVQGFDTEEDFWESYTRNNGWFRMSREARNRIENDNLQIMNMTSLHPAEMEAALTQANATLQSTMASYAQQLGDKQLEIEKEKRDIIIDAAAEVKKMWLKLAQNTEKYLENFDNITNDLGISLGYTNKNQLHDYQKTMFNIVENVTSKFGKDIEDAVKNQQSFVDTTGRNRMFDEHDYGQMSALGKYLGDDGMAANYASEMEIFNVGVADSVDMLDKVLQDVNRIGLNGRKYTKTLVDSLKLAQKYNFKGGTENLMKMAKWAENTRFNMNSLSGMLDKVSEGGLEGVITQGAQFQVLGGHAAINADPIAMMFERYADPDAFAKRMQDMTIGYGQLDRKTGETKFSGPEQMLMEQLAKIQGRSVEDVMNEVRARNKKEVVSKQITGSFDDDEKAFISNNATYNKKTGQFQVKVKQGNEYVDKDVSSLTKEDLENLMPKQHEERMEKYMQDVVSAVEGIKGEEIAEKANIAAATYEEMLNAYAERTKIAHDSFAKNREEYIEETKKGMEEATKAFHDYIGIFEQGNEEVNKAVKGIEDTANNIKKALDSTASIIQEANKKIASITAPTAPNISLPTSKQTTQNKNNRRDNITKAASDYMNKEMMWTMTNSGATGKSHYAKLHSAFANNKDADLISAMEETGLFTHSMKHYLKKYGIDWGSLSESEKIKVAQEFHNDIKSPAKMSLQGNQEYWNPTTYDWKPTVIDKRKPSSQKQLENTIYNNAWGVYGGLGFKDGIVKANGNPMYAEAAAITPITDGSVKIAKTHPDDTGLFAKTGGPFDTLFNDIFGEIREIYGFIHGRGGMGAHFSSDMHSVRNIEHLPLTLDNRSTGSDFGGTVHLDTLRVEMSGKLELSSGGQTVDIMSEIQRNPLLLRTLSQMMAEQISKSINGGKGLHPFSYGSI